MAEILSSHRPIGNHWKAQWTLLAPERAGPFVDQSRRTAGVGCWTAGCSFPKLPGGLHLSLSTAAPHAPRRLPTPAHPSPSIIHDPSHLIFVLVSRSPVLVTLFSFVLLFFAFSHHPFNLPPLTAWTCCPDRSCLSAACHTGRLGCGVNNGVIKLHACSFRSLAPPARHPITWSHHCPSFPPPFFSNPKATPR